MCIFKDYVAPFVPLVAALLVYFLGRAAYFRQKEYELLIKRYLDEGIDAIAKNVDRSLALFRHNWWQSTVLLKHFRDLGKDIRPELYREAFSAPDESLFEVWRDYRLNDIVGNDIFNRAHQSLDAFVRSTYAFFKDDLATMVRVTVEGGEELEVKASRTQMISEYLEEVERLDREARRYYVLLGELQAISSVIQSERFSLKSIKHLKDRVEVVNAVSRLKNHFTDTLESSDAVNKPPQQTH